MNSEFENSIQTIKVQIQSIESTFNIGMKAREVMIGLLASPESRELALERLVEVDNQVLKMFPMLLDVAKLLVEVIEGAEIVE